MEGKKIVKALFTDEHTSLTEGEKYEVLFEYDTVYEVKLDNGKIGCRNKDFFEIVSQ